jgi:hypothetical protein
VHLRCKCYINPLVAFHNIHRKKGRGAILLFCPGHHTRQIPYYTNFDKISVTRRNIADVSAATPGIKSECYVMLRDWFYAKKTCVMYKHQQEKLSTTLNFPIKFMHSSEVTKVEINLRNLTIAYSLTCCYSKKTIPTIGTINSTSDWTLWTLYRSYFKGITTNIELQVYSVTCCWPYSSTYLWNSFFWILMWQK